jgi:hypothetical protein
VESIQLGFGLLDERPAAIIETVRDHLRDSIPRAPLLARRELREAFVKYAEAALKEAERRGRRLLRGITVIQEGGVRRPRRGLKTFPGGKIDRWTKGARQYVCLDCTCRRDVVANGRWDYKSCFRVLTMKTAPELVTPSRAGLASAPSVG